MSPRSLMKFLAANPDMFQLMDSLVLRSHILGGLFFAPENRPSQKETIVFQPSIFRAYVSFREGNCLTFFWPWSFDVLVTHITFLCTMLDGIWMDQNSLTLNYIYHDFHPVRPILIANVGNSSSLIFLIILKMNKLNNSKIVVWPGRHGNAALGACVELLNNLIRCKSLTRFPVLGPRGAKSCMCFNVF